LLRTINTEDDRVRFSVFIRDDGRLRLDKDVLKDGDEYTGSYWASDQLGLFESESDIAACLAATSPKPIEAWHG
jgi:hypothetical protein